MHASASKNGDGWILRHTRNVRICHWINVIAVAYLIVSGIHIFLDFPELYWGKVGFQGHPAAFRLSDWGISWERAGELGDRRWGRNYHFLFAWVFTINGLVYVAWGWYKRHFGTNLSVSRADLSGSNLKADLRRHTRFRAHRGRKGARYGVVQRLAYLGMIFVLTPILFLTGLAQMPAFTAIAPWLIEMMGGRQTARTLHTIAMLVVILFVLIHVFQVFVAGFVNEVRAMITGRFRLSPEEDR